MDITKFCAPGDIRHYLHKPMRHEGFLYATNGHIAVRVADDPAIEAEPMPANLQNSVLQKMATDTTDRTWRPVPQVNGAAAKPCAYCDGTGRVVECPDCDGDGEFEHGDHTYECKACDASGWVASPIKGAGAKCHDCHVSGISWQETVEFDGVHIAARHIYLIGTEIPGAEIGISKDPTGIQLFRAPGIVGCVMPMRV